MYARAKELMLLLPAPEDHQAVVSISEAVSPIPLRMKKRKCMDCFFEVVGREFSRVSEVGERVPGSCCSVACPVILCKGVSP